MRIADESREQWVKDLSAILGVTDTRVAKDLYVLLKNLSCHSILEQYLENPDTNEFKINISPYGTGILKRQEDGTFIISDITICPSFLSTLLNTILTKESLLYRSTYEHVKSRIRYHLENFSESGEFYSE